MTFTRQWMSRLVTRRWRPCFQVNINPAITSCQPLEERVLLAAAAIELTPNEQLLLELINRARANPSMEAARYGIDLNQGLAAGTISTAPKQPLAPNQLLIDVAGAHSQDMLDRDYFAHTAPPPGHPGGAAYNPDNPPSGSVTFDQRITDSGYPWQMVGENISWGGITPSTFPVDQVQHVYDRHQGLFLSPGHRVNILTNEFREIGTGVRYGLFTNPNNGITYNASMVSEEFGNRMGNGFITGVVFHDGRNGLAADDFYTIGEQVSSGTIEAISASGQVYSITIGPSGGYALQVPNGTYTLTASGGGVSGRYVVSNIVVAGGRNVKVDFDTSEPSTPPPPSAEMASIFGRLNDGRMWIAASNGEGFTNQLWATLPRGVDWQNFQVGDFNNDGKDDVAARDNEGDWWVWIAGTSSFTSSEWGGRWSASVAWSDVRTGDFNGDGFSDIAGRAPNGQWYFALSNGSGFTTQQWRAWNRTATWVDVSVGDFNGDGIDDIAGRIQENGSWLILQSNGGGLDHVNLVGGKWSPNAGWTDVRVGDFDNDGNDDIIGRTSGGAWYVGFSNGNGLTTVYTKTWRTNVTWHDITVGDFNNDGRADIAGRASTGGWYIMYSTEGTGAGTTFSINYDAGRWSANANWVNVVAGDFDGDGDTDIAGRASNGFWYVARSDGGKFINEQWGSWSTVHIWNDVQSIHVT